MSQNERSIVWKILAKFSFVIIFAFLYCIAGSGDFGGMKWLRRFLAPAVLCGGMFLFSRDWRSLVQLPFMFASMSLGYGGDSILIKVLKRGVFGLANGITTSGRNILHKKWLLVGFQTILIISSYICFGVWNPFPSARAEEFILGVFLAAIPMLSV